jgi:dienelactone hydrolase
MKSATKKLIIWLISIAIVVGGCVIYVSDYYRADKDTIALLTADHSVEPIQISKDVLSFEPETPSAGFIFYPGGKVEYTSYIPLMSALADEGVLCILIKMPCNLAVFDMNAAKGITDKYPDIDDWYIGGHSLGGSMAASYASKNTDEIDGLVLLGSYSTADISVPVLSIYGSEDGVMNREKYEKYKPNIDDALTEKVIGGGNHALFGSYGAQKGDGMPSVSNEEQIHITVEEIIKFINKE